MHATKDYERDIEISPDINLVIGHYCDWNGRVENLWYFNQNCSICKAFNIDSDKGFKTTDSARKYAIMKIQKFWKDNLKYIFDVDVR